MDPVKLQSLPVDWIRGAPETGRGNSRDKNRSQFGSSWQSVDRAAAGTVGDGLDIDLTLGLVWYEQNENFVFDMRNEVLKTGTKCSSPIQVRFRCPGRPRFRVRHVMDSGRECVNAAATTDSCDTVLVYHEGAGSGTEMTEIGIGESAMVDDVAERVDIEIFESRNQENE